MQNYSIQNCRDDAFRSFLQTNKEIDKIKKLTSNTSDFVNVNINNDKISYKSNIELKECSKCKKKIDKEYLIIGMCYNCYRETLES